MLQNTPNTIYISQARDTPLGPIAIAVSEHGLAGVKIGADLDTFGQQMGKRMGASIEINSERTADAVHQITEYLKGRRQTFDLPIDWTNLRPFQKQVLREVVAIPFGETRTYGEIARQTGRPGATQAVGRANATNPIPLVLPCHRVMGTDGKLRGYSAPGGIKTKAWLLGLERKQISK